MSSLKNHFPYFEKHPELVYLDSAATSHKPKVMIDRLTRFYTEECATVHRAIYKPSLKATESYNQTRETVQKFINAKEVDEIVFTKGTTESLNLVARSFGKASLAPGDEILISEMEHHSNHVPWQLLAKETGAVLRFIPIDNRGVLLWEGTITPKTKIVSLAHVSNVTGTINPIKEIATAAHMVGAVMVVDGAQAAPHMKIDVQKLNCDFYAFSAHKCYGPTGVGVLYGKKELLNKMPPLFGGGDMIEKVDLLTSTYQEAPLRFEAGTPAIGSVVAFKASLDFLTEVGLPKIEEHTDHLSHLAHQKIAKIPGVKILGRAPNKGPLLSFLVEGFHPLDIATMLDLEDIAIRSGHMCAQPLMRRFGTDVAMRASFGMYNTVSDVDRFVVGLSKVLDRLRSASGKTAPCTFS